MVRRSRTITALSLAASGELDKAKSIYQDILKTDSSNVIALSNYSVLLIKRIKDKKEGAKQLNRLKFLGDDKATGKLVEELDAALEDGK